MGTVALYRVSSTGLGWGKRKRNRRREQKIASREDVLECSDMMSASWCDVPIQMMCKLV